MSQATLSRRSLGGGALFVFSTGASSPLTVLVGGVVATYALTGVVGVPLSFLVIMVVLVLLLVGYVAMSRHVPHSAPFYAQLARGLNPAVGVAGSAVALLGYNTIQISLYGLVGATIAEMVGGAWWVSAAWAWAAVAVLGRLRAATNAVILGSLLAVEIATIVLFDIAAFTNPADGAVSVTPLMVDSLLTPGVSGALAFAMAAYTGGESPPAFGEEARSSKAVLRATFGGVTFLGVFYALTSWAYAEAVGPTRVAEAAADPDRAPLVVLGHMYGPAVTAMATVLLVTSVLAAKVSFHATTARYVYALAKERVLPQALKRVSSGATGGAPLGGSLVQSTVSAIVIGVFAVTGADPMTMFVWLSTIGAFSILLLLTLSSVAARAYFTAGGGIRESVWVRKVFPSLGSVVGVLVLVFMVGNLSALLGTPAGSALPWLVPALAATAALIGLARGGRLRRTQPEIYRRLGHGTPNPVTVQDQRLSGLAV